MSLLFCDSSHRLKTIGNTSVISQLQTLLDHLSRGRRRTTSQQAPTHQYQQPTTQEKTTQKLNTATYIHRRHDRVVADRGYHSCQARSHGRQCIGVCIQRLLCCFKDGKVHGMGRQTRAQHCTDAPKEPERSFFSHELPRCLSSGQSERVANPRAALALHVCLVSNNHNCTIVR